MRILIIGASGIIGRRLVSRLSAKHQIITADRKSGGILVDIRSEDAIDRMYREA